MRLLVSVFLFLLFLSLVNAQSDTADDGTTVFPTEETSDEISDFVTFSPTVSPSVFPSDSPSISPTEYSALNEEDVVYTDCAISDFYSTLMSQDPDPLNWSKDDIRTLLTDQHRSQLLLVDATNSSLETIDEALKDLFRSPNDPNSIRLFFRDIDFPVPATQDNILQNWRPGNLWPISQGGDAFSSTKAASDAHVKQPIDSIVNDVVQNLFFGVCGTVEDSARCSTPAVPLETAEDTSQDGKIKTPPIAKRGDVARALFYNALRYETELGLSLTDCPPFSDTEYGYLSVLLQWHMDDPPSYEEQNRNDRICSRWQGNRNVFVDYPELVTKFWPQPIDTIREGTRTYSACTAPTMSPTATPNECSAVQAGDIQIYLVNSNNDEPDQEQTQVVFFTISNIPQGVEKLYLTDKAWDGNDFPNFVTNTVNTDGVVQYTIGEGGLSPGEVFAYGVNDNYNGTWSTVEGEAKISLSSRDGDSLLLYCENADGDPHFIAGLINNDKAIWSPEGQASYLGNECVLPERLRDDGSVALPFFPNYHYRGITAGSRAQLVEFFKYATSYEGSAEPFKLQASGGASNQRMITLSALLMSGVAIMMMII